MKMNTVFFAIFRGMNMRKRITFLIFTFLSSAFCFASPKWITDLEKAFPTVDYIRTVGEGNSETFAKKAALSELSSYFNQTISSQTQALKSIERENSSYIEKDDVRQNLITSTKSELFSVQYTNTVYDKNLEKFYVCAYLVRKDVWNAISQKMDVVMNNCKSSLKQINKETEILNQLIQLNQTERLYSDFYSLYEMALAIYSHRCSEYTAFAEKIVLELSVLSSIRAQAAIKVIVNGDKQNRIKGKICSLLSQNGITVVEKNARYVLNADVIWNESQFNGIYSCIPQIQITVSNNNTELAFFAAKCERLSAYNQETIEQIAFANLEEQLEERFITECFQ